MSTSGNETSSSTLRQSQTALEALLNAPAGTPPAGIQPSFDNPANLNTIVYITKVLAFTVTSLAVFIRIYTRHVILSSMKYDDCEYSISLLGPSKVP